MEKNLALKKIEISVVAKTQYLLIKSEGEISNFEEWKDLNDRYYELLKSSTLNKAIIDGRKIVRPKESGQLIQLIDHYNRNYAFEFRSTRIASVITKEYAFYGQIWEGNCNMKGFSEFKVFYDIDEAIKWVNQN